MLLVDIMIVGQFTGTTTSASAIYIGHLHVGG
jgi:hypothetical protein